MSVCIRTHSVGVANLPFDVIIIEPRSGRRETSWKTILAYPRSSGRQRAAHLGPVRWAGPQVGPELIRRSRPRPAADLEQYSRIFEQEAQPSTDHPNLQGSPGPSLPCDGTRPETCSPRAAPERSHRRDPHDKLAVAAQQRLAERVERHSGAEARAVRRPASARGAAPRASRLRAFSPTIALPAVR
jgi:hypothetical protein